MQSWADSFLFLHSRSDSFISPKSNLWKKIRLHSYTYGCFLVSGAGVVQFLSIKTSIPCIFYSCCNFYVKKGRGNFWRPQFALWRPNIYTWLPVGARIKKLISDPVYWFRLSLLHKIQVAMQFPAKITLSCIWVAIHVDWVILHWYACGADRRWASRRSCDYQNFSDG